MLLAYCKHCGNELEGVGNFCPSCGGGLSENSKKIGVLHTNDNLLKLILNSIILFFYVISTFYMFGLLISATTELPILMMDDMSLYGFIFVLIYSFAVLIISRLFNYLWVSKVILKITYIVMYVIITIMIFKLIGSLFVLLDETKVIEAVIGDYYWGPYDTIDIESAVAESRLIYFKFYVLQLFLICTSAIGYLLIMMKRYYSMSKSTFSNGLKAIFSKYFFAQNIEIFRNIGKLKE